MLGAGDSYTEGKATDRIGSHRLRDVGVFSFRDRWLFLAGGWGSERGLSIDALGVVCWEVFIGR